MLYEVITHFFRFAFAEADAATLVADDHEGCEAEALTTLHGFRHTVDRDEAICEFRITSYNVCYTKLLRTTISTEVPPK